MAAKASRCCMGARSQLADHFRGTIAEHQFGGVIPASDLAVIGACHDGVIGGLYQISQERSLSLETLDLIFRLLPGGNVAQDFGGTDDFTRQIADRRYSEGNMQPAAILAQAYGLIMCNNFSARHARYDLVLFLK